MALTRLDGTLLETDADIESVLVGSAVTINSSGVILAGAGITLRNSNNQVALDISAGSNISPAIIFKNAGGSAPAVLHIEENADSSGHYGLFVGSSDRTSSVLITKSNQVGIGSTQPTSNYALDINGDLSLGEKGGLDNTFIDQKQNGSLHIINSGREADNGRISINKTNTITGDTTYYRDVEIYDGKDNLLMYIDGSARQTSLGIAGTIHAYFRHDSNDRSKPILSLKSVNANGFTLLSDHYFGTTESLTNWGLSYSNSSTVIGAFCRPGISTEDTFIASQSQFSIKPSAISISGAAGFRYFGTDTASNKGEGHPVDLNKLFHIDTAGRVLKPYQPAFYARQGSQTTDTTMGSFLTDDDDGGGKSIYYNNGGHFNATNGRFTAPVAGTYVFFTTVMSDNYRNYHWFRFYRNGYSASITHHTHLDANESYRSLSGTLVTELAANDYVQVYVYGRTYGSGWSSFGGYLLG